MQDTNTKLWTGIFMSLRKKTNYNKIRSWDAIEPPETVGRMWHYNLCKQKKDPFEVFENKRVCKYTGLPITQNKKALHPKHIAETGYCLYCGRLE